MRYSRLVLLLCGSLAFSCNNSTIGGNTPTGDLVGLISIRVEPPDQTLESTPSQPATSVYKAIGTFPDGERDITSLSTFFLDNFAIGGFAKEQFQGSQNQGGESLVHAQAGDKTGDAHLLVRFSATVKVDPPTGQGNPLPADPGASFQGTANAARAPKLVYPNDGVMLPPNIGALEVHWQPGAAQNNLFRLQFQSKTTNVVTYTRCGTMVNNGCIFQLDPNTYTYVSHSNAGGEPVKLTVSGSDDMATGFGDSTQFQMQFSQENVEGGLYYWTVSGDTGIMRVDFGATTIMPTRFISPSQNGLPVCVGCHAISRDGTKMVSSLGGQNDGRLVFIANMAAPAASLLTLNGTVQASTDNHIQFATFNPDGSRFVAVYGDTGAANAERHSLHMHDGNTGLRIKDEAILFNFEPNHPEWSPSGALIAFDKVGIHQTSQRPFNCGIEFIQKTGTGWSAPTTVVPIIAGHNRFNPNFAPDSSFFVYTDSTCPGGNNTSGDCDGDSDPSSKTWAARPQAGAPLVQLVRAAAPGVMDGTRTDLADTYPRFSPFQKKQGTGRLFWATIASARRGGLRDPSGKTWLWMFAIDPDKVNAGQDGSYPGFWLPFQDLNTSNHIGQWTQKIVIGPG